MDILFISPVRYDDLHQRHQSLAEQMVKRGHHVIYVDPFYANGARLFIKNQFGLSVVSGLIPFKSSSYPDMQKVSVRLALFLLIKKLHLVKKNTVLWLADPAYAELTNFKWAKIIYDCCDLHGAFPGQKKEIWEAYENQIAERADKLVVSHPYLREHLGDKFKEKCVLLPNATSMRAIERQFKTFYFPKYKLLSSGAHYGWIDIDWLKMLAKHKRIELNIAGPGRGKAFEELIGMENVVYHGILNQEQLFELTHKCDVGLIPFKNIDLIKAVDPIKAYDYAACELRIWAPDIPALYSNKYITSFIKDSEDIEKAIKQIPGDNEKHYPYDVPTWDQRGKILEDIL